ncbi:e3 ubiquitin-protein ligase RNF13 [Trichonephila clavipes]|nr:e3 ubiquitin-protein ligase RNF13 [Trichonephila clavipes]
MALHTITPAVGAVFSRKAKAGLKRSPRGLHTRTGLSLLLRLNLDSSLKTTWFHSTAVQILVRRTTPNEGVHGWVSRAAHVIGTAIPNVLQPGVIVWIEKTQGSLMKVLPVPGCRPLKQLAVRVHFLLIWRSSRRLVCRERPEPDLRVNDISRIHWSQHLLTTQSERPS